MYAEFVSTFLPQIWTDMEKVIPCKGIWILYVYIFEFELIQKALVQKPVHQSSTSIERKLGHIVADF